MNLPVAELVGALPPGTRMHEYVLERVLGHGGFGITYLARDTHLDKPVAIKEYLPNDLAARMPDTSVTARSNDILEAFRWGLAQFVKEARILARFSHPSLIQVHRYFEANGTAYFVMDYAEGVTLATVLKEKNTIAEAQLRTIIFPVLNGLEEVHRLGVLHRDIKPDNIILRHEGSLPILIDFGAARQNLGSMTKSVMSVVTAGYAPLEQYGADMTQGPWTDLYAMGAVAYRAICGKKPSDAVNRLRLDPVVPAAVIGKGRYAPHFLAAVDWALAVNPEDRPQSIADWRLALDGERIPPPQPVQKTQKPARTSENSQDKTEILKKSEKAGLGDISASSATRKAPAGNSALSFVRRNQQIFLKSRPEQRRIAGIISGGLALGVVALIWLASRPEPPPPAPEKTVAVPISPAPSLPAAVTEQPAAPPPESKRAETPPAQNVPLKPVKPAKSKQAAVAQMAPLASFRDCPQCPVMVALPVGAYSMGSAPGAAGAANWEGPARRVSFAKPFAIGKFEVTTAEWQSCVRARACATLSASAGGPESSSMMPAVNVNWDEAQSYSNWLSKTTGRRYRLPSEAEWEYAIRGGTVSARFWGEDRRGQCEHANGADLSALKRDRSLRAGDQPCDDGHATLAPVGRFKPNAFGLHDLAGNAWEWTLDCWVDSYKGAPADGRAVDAPNCAKRVIRGGSWRTKPESLRSANRGLSPAGFRGDDVGFRVVAE